MRRSAVALAVAALVGSTLAFAPAVTDQRAEPVTDHAIVFAGDGSETVEGAAETAGTNLGELSTGCSKDPDTYCETVHVTVQQPVEDTTDEIDFGTGEATFTLAPAVPGADFDVRVLETNADGSDRGPEVTSSGNFPGCSVLCESPASAVIGEGCGPDHDECGAWGVSSTDLNDGTKYYLIEVVYYLAGGGYTLDVTYERTDGAGADGTTDETTDENTGDTGTTDGPGVAADSVEPVDVTGGFEKVGDWGGGGNNAALGDALGQDIEAAYIGYADDTFTFVIDLVSLPPVGGTPEATRYGWSFRYNDLELELDGKFTNYTRGTCDPTAGTCPPPRDPGLNQFLLRGNCYEDTTLPMTLTLCEELANVTATFDPSDGTITVPIPASALAPEGVRACDEIVGLDSFIGQSVWSAPSAFVTNTAMPYDDALHYVPLVVPHADPALTC